MVGAVLVKGARIIGRGWHRKAGLPHAEIEALRDAQKHGHSPRGATLYVSLEPCCTHGRTPPCTDAIIAAGIQRVVVGITDPNPNHAGKGFKILRREGIAVSIINELADSGRRCLPGARVPTGPMVLHRRAASVAPYQRVADQCARLNETFNHWIVHRTPFVTVKAAMTLDGKIATASGESKWITGEKARAHAMKLRRGSDAILVGVNTILADDPALTVRPGGRERPGRMEGERFKLAKPVRRIVLDSLARTPLTAKVVGDQAAAFTTIVVSKHAPRQRVAALVKRVNVIVAPTAKISSPVAGRPSLDLPWLLKRLGADNVTSLLVEGGGEVNASFLLGGLAQRVAFFYAPKVLGGRSARKGVAGEGAKRLNDVLPLHAVRWRKLGDDLLLTALAGRRLAS
jgi:diaminohydroxyphosphoribosylaminopyrimidine deaminase/5-amino-6-(5-phosphoribosylamino)uracil reductase